MPVVAENDVVSPVSESLQTFMRARRPELHCTFGIELESQFRHIPGVWDSEAFRREYPIDRTTMSEYMETTIPARIYDQLVRQHRNILTAFGYDRETVLTTMERRLQRDTTSRWYRGGSGSRRPIEIDGLICGTDGSVSGYEHRTRGGETIDNLLDIARGYYEAIGANTGLYADHHCSAHIHIKVKGIRKHIGNQKLYWLIVDEASKVWASSEFPKVFQDRLNPEVSGDQSRYYRPQSVRTEKYNTCRLHGEYGTWEFRLWGNCQNVDEVQFAAMSSASILQNAYRRHLDNDTDTILAIFDMGRFKDYFGLSDSDIDEKEYCSVLNQSLASLYFEAMRQRCTIDRVIETQRTKGGLIGRLLA